MAESERGKMEVLNLQEKFQLFTEHWQPRVIAECNDYQFKLSRLQGDFVWHSHPETDEVFFVVDGELTLEFRDRTTTLRAGELLVIPRNVEHKPSAERECHLLVIEPRGVANTGDQGGDRTAPNDVWV